MTNNLPMTLALKGADQTEALGVAIGQCLKGGEVIELSSDLGGGKTTFVRGLARGAGSADHVSSPTFTVSKVYDTDNFQIHHFDFYRLAEAGIVRDELEELLDDPAIVVVVEWSDVVQAALPDNRLAITFTVDSESSRLVELRGSAGLGYLVEAIA